MAEDQTPTGAALSDEERDDFRAHLRQNLGYRAWVIEDTMLSHVDRILAARDAAAAGQVALCSQCGERLSCMVKIGTNDGWCATCLDEAAEPAGQVADAVLERIAQAIERLPLTLSASGYTSVPRSPAVIRTDAAKLVRAAALREAGEDRG